MQFELAGQRQDGSHFGNRVHVARFEKARHDPYVPVRLYRLATLESDQAIGSLFQLLRIGIDQLDAVYGNHDVRILTQGADADGAVMADIHLFLGRNGDRPAIAHHRHAIGGAQHAQHVNIQAAGTDISLAPIRSLHGDPALPFDGHIQIPTGLLQSPRSKIGARTLRHRIDARRMAVAENLHRASLLEVTAKTGSGNVRQIVGMSLLGPRVLAGTGHGHVEHLVHRLLRDASLTLAILLMSKNARRMPLRTASFNCLILIGFSKSKKAPKGLLWQERRNTAVGGNLPLPYLSTQIDDRLGDRAFGLDGLGVGLVVALRNDQIDQLVRQLDVGVFQRSSLERTQRSGARCTHYRFA